MARVALFDDWVDLFKEWQEDIGLDHRVGQEQRFETRFGDLATSEIEFGAFAGQPKWESVRQIPDQRVRDALLTYLIVQGDTEFASVEQQLHLVGSAPTDYDLRSLLRILGEEMRHGWQMSSLLVSHFGSSGRLEAEKMLYRRAGKGERLLGAFNVPVENWLDLFTYLEFQDRDGKFQLTLLSHSSFAPLARSIGPMLKEEAFHLGTGHTGLKRIVQAGKVPLEILQRYLNRWVPPCYDLFGNDNSSSAQWGYVWGLKGRYAEGPGTPPVDREHLNEEAREHYLRECQTLVDDLNRSVVEPQQPLFLPDPRFNRRIGTYADQPYDIQGNLLSMDSFPEYLERALPTEADQLALVSTFAEAGWIQPRDASPST